MDKNEVTPEEAERLLQEAFGDMPADEPVVEEEVEETPEETEEEAEGTEEVEEEDKPEKAAAVEEDSWLEEVPDTVRDKVKEHLDKLKAAEQRIRSDDGRVRAFQRKADELSLKLQQLSNKPLQNTPAAELPSTPEEWQQVVDHDPVLAKAIEARVKAELQEFKKTSVDPLQQHNTSREEREYLETVSRETELLERAIPDVRDIVESPMFQGWLEHEAPPSIKHTYHNSLDHRDYIAVLNQFALTMVNTGRVQPNEPTTGGAPAPKQSVVAPEKAQEIAQQRARKLQQTPVGGRGVVAPTREDPNKQLTEEDAQALLTELFKNDK